MAGGFSSEGVGAGENTASKSAVWSSLPSREVRAPGSPSSDAGVRTDGAEGSAASAAVSAEAGAGAVSGEKS